MAKKAVKTKNLARRSHHESRVLNGLYFHFFKLQGLTSNKLSNISDHDTYLEGRLHKNW